MNRKEIDLQCKVDIERGNRFMKKWKVVLFLLCCLFSQIGFAAETAKKLAVCLIYKVPDTVLQSQNKEEDMVAGQKEFEKDLLKAYSKRFDVREMKRVDEKETHPTQEYVAMAKPGEIPLLVLVKLEGNGVSVDHYQNAFGAKVDGVAPSTFVHIQEGTIDRNDNSFCGWDYGKREYTAGTFSMGRMVAAVDTDPRRNTKNAVKAALKDVCALTPGINKYTNPEMYTIDLYRFQGDFKKASELNQQRKAAQDVKEAPLRARVDKFINYVHNHPELGITNLVDANQNDLSLMKDFMDSYIKMGLYKEE